jgi:hypothetical protein
MNPFHDRNTQDETPRSCDTGSALAASASRAQTKSTLDDLMNTLQELEADEQLVEKKPEKKKNWCKYSRSLCDGQRQGLLS